MAGPRDDEEKHEQPGKAEARRARLGQALRDNLLKRKAQKRARNGAGTPPKEGGQERG